MLVKQHGVVIFTQGDIKVENWQIEREPDDPKEATDNQLLLAYAVHFAQEKFAQAMQGETKKLIQQLVQRHKEKFLAQKQKAQEN